MSALSPHMNYYIEQDHPDWAYWTCLWQDNADELHMHVNMKDLNVISRAHNSTALQDAVLTLAVKCVGWLLDRGADPNCRGKHVDDRLQSPLDLTCRNYRNDPHDREKQSKCVLLLLRAGANATYEGDLKITWITRAIYADLNNDVMRALIDAAPKGIIFPLYAFNVPDWIYEYAVKSGK